MFTDLVHNMYTSMSQELGAEDSLRNRASCSFKVDNELKINKQRKDVTSRLIFLLHWDALKSVQNIRIHTQRGLLAWKVMEFIVEPTDVSDQILS